MIGRSLMRGVPSRMNSPFPAQRTAASGRIAVPAFPIIYKWMEEREYGIYERC